MAAGAPWYLFGAVVRRDCRDLARERMAIFIVGFLYRFKRMIWKNNVKILLLIVLTIDFFLSSNKLVNITVQMIIYNIKLTWNWFYIKKYNKLT